MFKARRGAAIIVGELETDLIWDCILYFVHIKLLSEVVVVEDVQNYELVSIVFLQFTIHFACCSDIFTIYIKGFLSFMNAYLFHFTFFFHHSRQSTKSNQPSF